MGDIGVPNPETQFIQNSLILSSPERSLSPLVQKELIALSPSRSAKNEALGQHRNNYKVPCPAHGQFEISNMCTAEGCLEPLCAECIRVHTLLHNKERTSSNIDTIFNKRDQCLDILQESSKLFENEKSSLQQVLGGEGKMDLFQKECNEQIQRAKIKVFSIVELFFKGVEDSVRQNLQQRQTSQVAHFGRQLDLKIKDNIQKIKNTELQLETSDFIPAIIEVLSGQFDVIYSTIHQETLEVIQQNQQNMFEIAFDEQKLYTLTMELSKLISLKKSIPETNSPSRSNSLNRSGNNKKDEPLRNGSPLKRHNQTVQQKILTSQQHSRNPSMHSSGSTPTLSVLQARQNNSILKQQNGQILTFQQYSQNKYNNERDFRTNQKKNSQTNYLMEQPDFSTPPVSSIGNTFSISKNSIPQSNQRQNIIFSNHQFPQRPTLVQPLPSLSSSNLNIQQENNLQQSVENQLQPQQLQLSQILVNSPDYFVPECDKKLLHFFQDNSKLFHYLDLDNLSRDPQSQAFKQLVLNIHFKIPMYHRSVITPYGEVFLLGGIQPDSKGISLNTCYKLNFRLSTLEQISSMHFARAHLGVTFCSNALYAVGGSSDNEISALDTCEKYDLNKGKWEIIASLKSKSSGCCLSTFSDSFIFKFGGTIDRNTLSNTIERYDIMNNTWTVIPFNGCLNKILPSFAACCQINQDEIMIFGGTIQNNHVSTVWIAKMYSEECDFAVASPLPRPGTFWSIPVIVGGVLFSLQNVTMDKSQDYCYFGKKRIYGHNSTTWKLIGNDPIFSNSSSISNFPEQSSRISQNIAQSLQV